MKISKNSYIIPQLHAKVKSSTCFPGMHTLPQQTPRLAQDLLVDAHPAFRFSAIE